MKVPAGGSPPSEGQSAVTVNDHGRLGLNARLYLNGEVPKLVVEVDAVKGSEPTPSALSTLRSRLTQVVDKPGGIQVLPVETFARESAPWTELELMSAQRAHRDRFSSRREIVLYLLYVNGTFAENEDALGVAFTSSTYAVFAEHIREMASTPLVSARAIETAVIVHEMGHVLALVNIGYTSPRDHEDADHKGHSNNPDSVMYWAVDNVGVAGILGGRTAPPSDFDTNDRADLEDIKNGRLRVD